MKTLIGFIWKWFQRWKRGYSDYDIGTVHDKMIGARDEMRPFTMNEYEERALRASVNQAGDFIDADE